MALDTAAKILIADDTLAMLVSLRRALAQLGYANIIEAENGEEALYLLRANSDTALLISDWNMEPMDGLELLRAVRADARFKTLPFILASADAAAVRKLAMLSGAMLVMQKPFSIETLQRALSDVA
jgi:two-component system chemotaxis response regulator CheY